jgi:hypothetical protein
MYSGGYSYALTCLAEKCLSPVYMPKWLSEKCLSPPYVITWTHAGNHHYLLPGRARWDAGLVPS